jgi:hypothetical protein
MGLTIGLLLAAGVSAAPHKEIHVAAQASPDGMYHSVLFCARPSEDTKVPGHAYLGFSRVKGGKRDFIALGHTTKAGAINAALTYKGFTPPITGTVEADRFSWITEKCLVVHTDKSRYDAAWKTAAGYKAMLGIDFEPGEGIALDYSLGDKDCMGLMIDVAKAFEPALKVPARGAVELPLAYLRRFIDAN